MYHRIIAIHLTDRDRYGDRIIADHIPQYKYASIMLSALRKEVDPAEHSFFKIVDSNYKLVRGIDRPNEDYGGDYGTTIDRTLPPGL